MIKTKVCSRCKEEKALDQFYKNSKGKSGRSQKCNVCSRYIAKHYRELNPAESLAKKYGAEVWEIEEVLSIPFCNICSAKDKRLVVDHCHKTGKIRGRLCASCNSALGLLQDSPFILEKAAKYLSRPRVAKKECG